MNFFYAWRKIEGMPNEVDGIELRFTLIQGMFNRKRLRDIIQNSFFFT
jgi:type I restriction enzyme R subunit